MLGIAVVSYNRIEGVKNAIKHIEENTVQPFELVVADDGSSDQSSSILRELGYTVVSGRNMGVCWNKNRALFYLAYVKKCSSIILMEDDTWPVAQGWESDWIEAIGYYGHINLAGAWFSQGFVSGSGTPNDPFLSSLFSGQCCGYGAESLSYVGYLDTRFHGYGSGHVEHTRRFIRAGYGGLYVRNGDRLDLRFLLINSSIKVTRESTYRNEDQVARNEHLLNEIRDESVYRAPWRTDLEMTQFRSEIRGAQSEISDLFDEAFYLQSYPDVAGAVSRGECASGELHYLQHGRHERRLARYVVRPTIT